MDELGIINSADESNQQSEMNSLRVRLVHLSAKPVLAVGACW